MPKNKKNGKWFDSAPIGLFIFLLLLLLIFTIGKFDFRNFFRGRKERTPREKELFKDLDLVKTKLNECIKRKERLERRFRIGFVMGRFLFVSLYLLLNVLAIFLWGCSLEDVINYNEGLVLLYLAFSFMFYGSFSNIKQQIEKSKDVIRGWVNYIFQAFEDVENDLIFFKQLEIELGAALENEENALPSESPRVIKRKIEITQGRIKADVLSYFR